MAADSPHYRLETLARREPYLKPDVDSRQLEPPERDLWKQLYGAPAELRPGFDAEDVWRRWKTRVPDEDVRPSEDAGLFLCEFIYFTGLVEYWRRGRERAPVGFLHVPGKSDEGSVRRGVRVAEALVRAMVESGRATGMLRQAAGV